MGYRQRLRQSRRGLHPLMRTEFMESELILAADASCLRVTMICTVVVVFKYIVTIFIQGGKNGKAGTRAPEDTQLKSFKGTQQGFDGSSDAADASKRKPAA